MVKLETETVVNSEEESVEENKTSTSSVRDSELFKKQAKIASEYKAKLEAYEAQALKVEQERQMKILQDKGDFEQILKQKESEFDILKSQFQKDLAKEKLSNALLIRGLTHPVAIKSAIADYNFELDVNEYVSNILESPDYSIFLHQDEVKGFTPPNPVSAAKNSTQNSTQVWQQIKADLNNPQKAKNASALIEEYYLKNGKLPW